MTASQKKGLGGKIVLVSVLVVLTGAVIYTGVTVMKMRQKEKEKEEAIEQAKAEATNATD